MNNEKTQDQWMLLKQRQRKSRSHSVPQAPIALELGNLGTRMLHPVGSTKVANYVNRIPQLIQVQHQNPPRQKLECNETLMESPWQELKSTSKKKGDDGPKIGSNAYRDVNVLSLEKGHEIRSSNMSTLQLPDLSKK